MEFDSLLLYNGDLVMKDMILFDVFEIFVIGGLECSLGVVWLSVSLNLEWRYRRGNN